MPLHYQHGFHSRLANLNRLLRYFLEDSAPLKLPIIYCLHSFLPRGLECISQRTVFHRRLHSVRERNFKVSRLRYAVETYTQYKIVVKLLGSFRLAAGNRHLHRYCIFTEQAPETVLQSLHYSCASELTRQGISLFSSLKKDSLLSLTSFVLKFL